MSEYQDNQPVDSGEVELTDAERELFGFDREEADQQLTDERDDEQDEEVEDEEEAEEEQEEETPAEEARRLRLKYNGEEKEITEEEAVVLAQKGMNYDKVQERLEQQKAELEKQKAELEEFRKAKLEADKLNHTALEENMIAELEAAGFDPQQVRQWLDNHPAIKAGREALEKAEQASAIEAQKEREQRESEEWAELLTAHPELTKDIKEGIRPAWLTDDMETLIGRGYKPIDAYYTLNREKIIADERKRIEQSVLKNNKLNKRAQSERNATGQYQSKLSKEELEAARLFNIDPKEMAKIK